MVTSCLIVGAKPPVVIGAKPPVVIVGAKPPVVSLLGTFSVCPRTSGVRPTMLCIHLLVGAKPLLGSLLGAACVCVCVCVCVSVRPVRQASPHNALHFI